MLVVPLKVLPVEQSLDLLAKLFVLWRGISCLGEGKDLLVIIISGFGKTKVTNNFVFLTPNPFRISVSWVTT